MLVPPHPSKGDNSDRSINYRPLVCRYPIQRRTSTVPPALPYIHNHKRYDNFPQSTLSGMREIMKNSENLVEFNKFLIGIRQTLHGYTADFSLIHSELLIAEGLLIFHRLHKFHQHFPLGIGLHLPARFLLQRKQ